MDGRDLFFALYSSWTHNPVATFSLCLLAQAYELASALVFQIADIEVTVGFLMQIDKLVQLLESPIFIRTMLSVLIL
jgi:vacuole morphology and inheritance protein 14